MFLYQANLGAVLVESVHLDTFDSSVHRVCIFDDS